MHLGSFLLVAGIAFFACVDATSTRSGWTFVRSAKSDRHDVPVQRFLRGVAKTNEERGINLFSLYEVTESVKSVASKVVAKALSWILRLSGKSVEDALTFLRLDHPGGINIQQGSIRFEEWVKFAVKSTDVIPLRVIQKVRKLYGDRGLVKLFEACVTVGGREDDVANLESELIKFWVTKKESADTVFNFLQLDRHTEDVLSEALFKLWGQYAIARMKDGYSVFDIELLIAPYDYKDRVTIVKCFEKIEGFEDVVKIVKSREAPLELEHSG